MFVIVQKNNYYFSKVLEINNPLCPSPFWSSLFGAFLSFFFILFAEIFSDTQAFKRFPPRAAGGAVAMLDSAVSVSDALHASAPALRLPLLPSASWGENVFTAPRNRTWYAAVFTPTRLDFGMELNEGATHSQAWLAGRWQALLVHL